MKKVMLVTQPFDTAMSATDRILQPEFRTRMKTLKLVRTTSDNPHFIVLVAGLDRDLAIRNGESNDFFAAFNKIDAIRHVVVAFEGQEAVGCGAMKLFEGTAMEIKRMFVPLAHRGRGIAFAVLRELEDWAAEEGYNRCVLETGDKMPEAIALYKRSNYQVIPNYGQYAGVESSICFEKVLNP